MADTSVNIFHWQMVGAPTLAGAAGGLIPVLDACLKDGFGLKTVTSLVIASGIATVTVATGHSGIKDGVQLIAGITGTYASLNGKQKVLTVVSPTVYTFDATGSADGSATGTITTKVNPLGWTTPYTGTNKKAYKSSHVASLGMYLRVDDSVTKNAVVRGYETMSDVDTGTGVFQIGASGGYFPKSATTDATTRPWFLIGDERAFYFWAEPNTGVSSGVTSQGILVYFGDINPRRSTDAYACTLISNEQDLTNTTSLLFFDAAIVAQGAREAYRCPRGQHGLGGQQTQGYYIASYKFGSSQTLKSGRFSQNFPNAADNGVDLDEVVLTDSDTASVRGRMPGLFGMPQNVDFAFSTFDTMDGANELSGKRLMFLRVGSSGATTQNSTTGQPGVVAFDVTGPWR